MTFEQKTTQEKSHTPFEDLPFASMMEKMMSGSGKDSGCMEMMSQMMGQQCGCADMMTMCGGTQDEKETTPDETPQKA